MEQITNFKTQNPNGGNDDMRKSLSGVGRVSPVPVLYTGILQVLPENPYSFPLEVN